MPSGEQKVAKGRVSDLRGDILGSGDSVTVIAFLDGVLARTRRGGSSYTKVSFHDTSDHRVYAH